jgi:peptidoglycan/LPS O-acetylase OafA/YrhL
MFLSGFLIFYAYRPIHSGSDYRQYIGKRIKKFVPAYLFFSLLFILINLLLNKISLQQIPDQLYRMALTPAQSSATFLWYLYVLLIFYAVTPVLQSLPRKLLYCVALGGLALTFMRFSHLFAANLAGKHFFFFMAGGLAVGWLDRLPMFLEQFGLYFLIGFILMGALVCTGFHVPYQLVSITAIVAVLYVSSIDRITKISLLRQIGRRSYHIYLLNTTVIGALYLMYTRTFFYDLFHAWVYIVVFTVLGTLVPLGISKVLSVKF